MLRCQQSAVGCVLTFAVAVPLLAGCAFDAQVPVHSSSAKPPQVTELAAPDQVTQRVRGVTIRPRQVVGIDCATTVVV
jgi:hypothetical protein